MPRRGETSKRVLVARAVAGAGAAVACLVAAASPGGVAATAAARPVAGATFAPLACPLDSQCVEVHADQLRGPARFVAQGFNDGVETTDNSSALPALRPQWWVAIPGSTAYTEARNAGAVTTAALGDAWFNATYSPARGGPVAPWNDLAAYGQWVRSYVASQLANGVRPNYWEIYNEPDGRFAGATRTPAQALAEFAVAATAVRQVDPTAKIIGPSISAYNDRPSATLDLATFLRFASDHNIKLDAVAWHEVGARASPLYSTPDPQSVLVHVAQVRQMIKSLPKLGHPQIFINEYGSAAQHAIPGWTVGWIAALEQANVDEANRACWHSLNVYGQLKSECSEGALDGLIIGGSSTLPQAVYSVHRAYAGMTGQRVVTSSTDGNNVSAFATRDDSAGTVKVLIGRHQSCTPAIRVDCHQPTGATPDPVNVTLQIDVPWAATPATLEVDRIANTTGVVLAPQPISLQLVNPGQGPIDLTIPGFADGDAYVVTLTSSGF